MSEASENDNKTVGCHDAGEPPAKKRKNSDEMQLYNDLDVVWGKLKELGYERDAKEIPFDAVNQATSLSYITDEELAEAGAFLLEGRDPKVSNILEVGSGLTRPLRSVCHNTGCKGTGVEYISAYVAHSNEINEKCGMAAGLKVYQGDAISGHIETGFCPKCDGMLSILCILHLPGSERQRIWSNIHSWLNPGARVFLHDFYAAGEIPEKTKSALADQGIAPDMPSKEEYLATLEKQGFTDIVFEDVTAMWSERVCSRHKAFKESRDKFIASTGLSEASFNSLLAFYTFVITDVFPPGGTNNLGGCVVKCTRS